MTSRLPPLVYTHIGLRNGLSGGPWTLSPRRAAAWSDVNTRQDAESVGLDNDARFDVAPRMAAPSDNSTRTPISRNGIARRIS